MNCLEFENVVHDLAGNNNDVVSPWQRGLDHAQGCERCAALLAEARAVRASLRTLAVADGGQQAGAHVEAALRTAFRNDRVVVPVSPRWKQWAIGGVIVGAAAAVVLALLLSFHGHLNGPQQPFANNTTTEPGASMPPADQRGTVSPAATPAEAPTVAAVESANASDGAFTPLPDSDDSLPLDNGAVIRVTMQRASLASFGLQVSDEDASSGQVAADVLLDQAGMPRAIRLVQ